MSTPSSDAPIKVLLVDDQQLVRAGFAMVIDSQADLHVVGEASDGAQAVRLCEALAPDVVLMDVRMPNMDGLRATELITGGASSHERTYEPKVIVLTTFDLDEYVLKAITAGASGFLLKDTPPEEMLEAIRTVYRGDGVIAPSSTKRLMDHLAITLPAGFESKPNEAIDSLTDREREVLVLMARGKSNTEIGQELFVADATVKTHVSRILAKLSARDRVQAVVAAYESGLIKPGG